MNAREFFYLVGDKRQIRFPSSAKAGERSRQGNKTGSRSSQRDPARLSYENTWRVITARQAEFLCY